MIDASFIRARLADNGYEVPENEIRLAILNWEALTSGTPGLRSSSFILDARQALREANSLSRHISTRAEQSLKDRLSELIAYAADLERKVDAQGYSAARQGVPTLHRKIRVEGEIEVCSECVNSLGYNVAWDQAHLAHPVQVEMTQDEIVWTLEVLRSIRHEHEWSAVEKALRKALEVPRGD